MSEARNEIFRRIREAHGRSTLTLEQQSKLEQRIAMPQPVLQPVLMGETVQRFIERAQRVAMTLEQLDSLDAVPAAVVRYMEKLGISQPLYLSGPLQSLPWPAQLSLRTGKADEQAVISVTTCVAAIAETGSIVCTSSADTPVTQYFAPEDHIVIVQRNQIVRYLEDAWAILRTKYANDWPRTVNLITGPSRTADVDQIVQIGVHGPRRVHVLLVN